MVAAKIANISMKAAIARISMRTPVAAANTVTDTAVVVMDRAVVDASDFLATGELRLVILDILTRDASHGYELIKAIENLTGGGYTPSAGVIYPTLDFLQDQQFITISDEEGGRKKIAITANGAQWLDENREHLTHIQARLKARCVGMELRKNPQMKRALDNFKAVLDLRINHSDINDAQIKRIIGVIDRAALEIAELD